MTRIRVRHGENEIELDGPLAFIKKQLDGFYGKIGMVVSQSSGKSLPQEIFKASSQGKGKKQPSPAEFYRLKGKSDGVGQLLVFAKYLETYRGVSEFTPKEINNLVKEARLSRDIHGQYYSNAVKQGLLRPLGNKKYSLTLSAEDYLGSV